MPKTVIILKISTPGVSIGTKICDCLWCFGLSGFETPMKIIILHLGSPAPEVHHFSPLMTYSSPSSTIELEMLVASEEATFGSVIPKADLISPASRGSNHSFFCSSVPYLSRTSIFPVSGAEQLKTSEAIPTVPINSDKGAYSRLVKP